ncbi:MAG: pentapeptide repeat-containing protein [Synechococcaceae cyanobacterium]|nr:pentapeptide repeat-containing protein [Synechococcaceae cyanobacterium]
MSKLSPLPSRLPRTLTRPPSRRLLHSLALRLPPRLLRRLPGLAPGLLLPLALLAAAAAPSGAAEAEALQRLLEQRACPGCRLQDADLVLADLADADLRRAQLQRANLSQARLDGARLAGADLSFTSLQGASLRGADLRGARLEGTDLRQSDLNGALLDPGALIRSHWTHAQGLPPGALAYAQLHNAGVDAFQARNWPEAERYFSQALSQKPDAALTWVARAIARSEQRKTQEAASDFGYAASLYEQEGDAANARQLRLAATQVTQPKDRGPGGNGIGNQILGGFMGLLPMAMKVLPMML